jgi:hypothetical protein
MLIQWQGMRIRPRYLNLLLYFLFIFWRGRVAEFTQLNARMM